MTMYTDQDPDCVFCRLVLDGKVETDPHMPAAWFEPLNPVVPGHMLFIPMWHVEHRTRATEAGLAIASRAAAVYARRQGVDYNLITSSGAAATQTIPHLHLHYVPRHADDGLALPWTGQQR
ncbi:histidine triad nucleotide binding protein [Gordonia phage MelBins]|uniref:Histidine triad nucleotide binding protein n=1 Tax=Gordonia phage MelBins TaxID=2656540 RepID=A0A649VMB6_9CAUD|nr:histidine triad nucleotide binding protein [Gordonia phage MelBins]QGJ93570.1 histidine triad nucleotide binding protein [Gordonia phage MelBins]